MPGRGGFIFVSYQAVGWALYAMAIVMSLWTLVSSVKVFWCLGTRTRACGLHQLPEVQTA